MKKSKTQTIQSLLKSKKPYIRLAGVSLVESAVLTALVWLRFRSTPYITLFHLDVLNILITLCITILAVFLVNNFIFKDKILTKELRKSSKTDSRLAVVIIFLNNLYRSLCVCLPSLVLIGFFFISSSYFRYDYWRSAQVWLNGYPWLFAVSFMLIFLSLLIGFVAINLVGFKKIPSIAAATTLLIVFCVLTYIPMHIQTQDFLNNLANILESTQQNENTGSNTVGSNTTGSDTLTNTFNTPSNIEKMNFEVYEPSYMPPGYSLIQHSNPELSYYGPQLSAANKFTPELYSISYATEGGDDFIDVNSYVTSSSYNPPQNCGIDINSFTNSQVTNCTFIGKSSIGCQVYDYIQTREYGPKLNETFCNIDDTTIYLQIDVPFVSGQSITSQAQYNQILKIYNSMHKLTTQQIISLSNS